MTTGSGDRDRSAKGPPAKAFTTVLTLLVVAGLPSMVRAEPEVVVHLRRADRTTTEATVEVRDGSAILGSCRTIDGTCEIRGVSPGRRTVVARTDDGRESPPHSVVIPPDGKVSLYVPTP